MNKLNHCFLLALFLYFNCHSLKAQNWITWNWNNYNLAVDLPDDFKEVKNNNNEFMAEGEGMEIYIYIFEADITLDEMKGATLTAASKMALEELDAIQNVKTRSFEGKYVAGYKDGDAVLFCGLINPENITNFFVAITFGDDDQVAEDDAFKILESIRTKN